MCGKEFSDSAVHKGERFSRPLLENTGLLLLLWLVHILYVRKALE